MRTRETLKSRGRKSIYVLAITLERNYSNVHSDIQRLITLGLVERDGDGFHVPFDAVEIHLCLGAAQAV